MQDYVKSYIDRIEAFARTKGNSIELILIGGLAMSFYGSPRYTIDIDAEIRDIVRIFNITKDALHERKRLIQFPKDPETLFFEKKFQHLIEMIR